MVANNTKTDDIKKNPDYVQTLQNQAQPEKDGERYFSAGGIMIQEGRKHLKPRTSFFSFFCTTI